jgi:hypothetical protein
MIKHVCFALKLNLYVTCFLNVVRLDYFGKPCQKWLVLTWVLTLSQWPGY